MPSGLQRSNQKLPAELLSLHFVNSEDSHMAGRAGGTLLNPSAPITDAATKEGAEVFREIGLAELSHVQPGSASHAALVV